MYRKLNRRHIQYITKTLREHHKILPAIFKTVYKTTLNLSYIATKESAKQFALAPQQKQAGTMSLQSVNLYCRLRESWKVWELINRRGLRQGIPPVGLYYQCENRRWSPAKKERNGPGDMTCVTNKRNYGERTRDRTFKNTQHLLETIFTNLINGIYY